VVVYVCRVLHTHDYRTFQGEGGRLLGSRTSNFYDPPAGTTVFVAPHEIA
jgi:hypothetical protein